MLTVGKTEGAAASIKARDLADKFVEDIAKIRKENVEKTVKSFKLPEGSDSNETLEATINTLTAKSDRELLQKILDLVSAMFPGDRADLNKIKNPESGALFLSAVVQASESRFISVRASSIKLLFDEVEEVLGKILKDDFKHSGAINSAKEIKKKAETWKYEALAQQGQSGYDRPPVVNGANALEEAVKFLLNSYKLLLEFRNAWRNLVTFFTDLAILLNVTLTQAVKNYADKVDLVLKGGNKSTAMKNLIINQAVLVCRGAFQVSVAATSYEQIHQNLLGPNIVKVTSLLGISDQSEITKVMNTAYTDCEAATNKMKVLTANVSNTTKDNYVKFVNKLCGR